MKVSQRQRWILGAIAVSVMLLLILAVAPANNQLRQGSTYSRDPDGYGAWYAFISGRGTPVQRWQQPLAALSAKHSSPLTLLRIDPQRRKQPDDLLPEEKSWVQTGNLLVILGVDEAVTEAAFSTFVSSQVGQIKIETSRRKQAAADPLLGDRFGAIAWTRDIGKGRAILVTTPYLAANAYQDFPGNYEWLAQLVTRPQHPVWVDEYLHGYKDKDAIAAEIGDDIFSYLAKTPLFPVMVQGAVIFLVALWAGNRRFGKPISLPSPTVNNSEAYIQALAGVLQKADSTDFLVSAIAQEEQRQLQKALGLGTDPLDAEVLGGAWLQQTGQPAQDFDALLKTPSSKHRLSQAATLAWLQQWHKIRQSLNLIRGTSNY
jgi:hypothetical protein